LSRTCRQSPSSTANPGPATRPHPLAFLNGLLWAGSWDTDAIYAIDAADWKVREHVAAPGKPYGMTAFGDELRVVVALDDDDRYLYRFVPGRGFDPASKVACPDFTGSYLAAGEATVFLGQMGKRRILALNEDSQPLREIALPTRCAGFGFGPHGHFFMISGDDELEHLKFGTLDVSQDAPEFEEIAPIDDNARSLVYDGRRWWTSLRDENQIASFT